MREIAKLQFPLVFREKDPALPLSTVQTLGKNHIGKAQPGDLVHG